MIFSPADLDLLTGSHYLRDCELDAVPNSYCPVHIQNGTLKATNNFFHNTAWPLDYEGLSNCSVEISRNQFTQVKWYHTISALSYSLLPGNPIAPQPSRYVITYNSIKEGSEAVDGIWIEDQSPDSKIKPYIAFNSIGGESLWSGIVTWNVDRGTIAANRLFGTGAVAVNLFGTTNTLVADNNVQKFTPIEWTPWYLPPPFVPPYDPIISSQIMLWNDTNHCTVIGKDLTDTATDLGADNKLIHLDLKPFQWVGRAGHDSMNHKMERRKHFREHWAR